MLSTDDKVAVVVATAGCCALVGAAMHDALLLTGASIATAAVVFAVAGKHAPRFAPSRRILVAACKLIVRASGRADWERPSLSPTASLAAARANPTWAWPSLLTHPAIDAGTAAVALADAPVWTLHHAVMNPAIGLDVLTCDAVCVAAGDWEMCSVRNEAALALGVARVRRAVDDLGPEAAAVAWRLICDGGSHSVVSALEAASALAGR